MLFSVWAPPPTLTHFYFVLGDSSGPPFPWTVRGEHPSINVTCFGFWYLVSRFLHFGL